MVSSKAKELRRLSLFSSLSDRDRELLAASLDEVSVPAGTTLISEGRHNHAFFVLREGQVEVLVGGQRRRVLGPGEFFGEIAMAAPIPATATVVTTTPVEAFVASHAQFAALQANHAVLDRLQAAITERLLADRQAAAQR